MCSKYIRFGAIPESGRSINHATREPESGVSCYRLVRIGAEWRIDGAIGSYMELSSSGLPLYEIAGDEIGTGSDGEPILRNARIVRKMRNPGRLRDCWERIAVEGIGCTEAIWRHMIHGGYWVALSGIEFRAADIAEVRANLKILAPRREIILA